MLEAQKESAKDKRRLLTAIALCGTFFLIELVGAMWSGSLALLSDSFHLMTDITSFVISLTAIYLSQRPSTAKYTFGFHRAEVLGALISIFLIWGLTLMLVVEAIGRLRNPINVDGKTMSVVAAVGVCVNISDDDLDQEQKSAALRDDEQGPKQRHVNLNMTAATLHVLGDLLSSIGVLTSSLIITFYPSLTFLDPVCTFVFSIMVIATTVGVFKNSVAILMERVPQGIDSDEIKDAVCDIPGVLEVKSLHVWSLTTGKAALAGTVYLQPEIKDLRRAAAIVSKSRGMIKKQYGIKECTIQVALYSPHAQALSQQRRFQRGSTKTALSKNDQDVVFSIGDDDLDEMISPSTLRLGAGLTHSQFLSQDITRSGTPLSMYRKNRHASDDEDDSENEMTTEIDLAVPLQIKPSQWV
ncbi:cation efflux family-domain-containing protein [Dissophora ornata]|nr:cation efflux family-domain-containing protein [Dissophora ornata]